MLCAMGYCLNQWMFLYMVIYLVRKADNLQYRITLIDIDKTPLQSEGGYD